MIDRRRERRRFQPASLPELDPAERLIVLAFRRWAQAIEDNTGHHACLVWNEFAKRFGSRDGRAAMSDFLSIVGTLQDHARRVVHYRRDCCPFLAADEVWLLRLVAACQHREPDRSRRLAESAVWPGGVARLLDASERLAHTMQAHALPLPPRDERYAPGEAAPAGVTVH